MLQANLSFGQWLRQQRHSHDLTQDALAQRIGCSSDLIRKIEAGSRRPSRQVAQLIAHSLEVAPEHWDALVQLARTAPTPPAATPSAGFPRPGAAQQPLPAPVAARFAEWSPSLIGRESEVRAVAALLYRPEARLITLTGPAGVGKTRLALGSAEEVGELFDDGIWVVDLAPVTDPQQMVMAIAQVLGLKEEGGRPLLETIQEQIQQRAMLLLLDNCEQVLEAGPSIGALLARCPRLKLLVTSRAPLRLRGEHELNVPPLALTGGAQHGPAAVRLFVERAHAVASQLALTAENLATIAAICARLDGLPLAIELAAARSRLLSPQALLAQLERPLTVLTGGPRNSPARQQTLRAAIGWSYELLEAREQALFSRLSVFSGGASIEAVAVVCAGAPEAMPELLDSLEALIDQSLVRREVDAEGQPRFTMLQTVHAFALDQLVRRDEAATIARRHAAFFAELAELAEPKLWSTERLTWIARLDREHHNLRAALGWCQSAEGEPALGLRLVNALWWFWFMRSRISEGRAWLSAALERSAAAPPELRARALPRAGLFAWFQSDYRQAQAWCAEGLARCRELGDRLGVAYALHGLGLVALDQGQPAAAQFAESLALLRELNDLWGSAWSLFRLGQTAWLFTPDDVPQAAGLLNESLTLFRLMDDEVGMAHALFMLGDVALGQNELERAYDLYTQSLTLCQRLDEKGTAIYALRGLAAVARRRADLRAAAERYSQSITLCQELRERRGLIFGLEGMAAVALDCGGASDAAVLLGAATKLRAELPFQLTPAERPEYERVHEMARSHLGAMSFDGAWGAGQTLGVERVLAIVWQCARQASATSPR